MNASELTACGLLQRQHDNSRSAIPEAADGSVADVHISLTVDNGDLTSLESRTDLLQHLVPLAEDDDAIFRRLPDGHIALADRNGKGTPKQKVSDLVSFRMR